MLLRFINIKPLRYDNDKFFICQTLNVKIKQIDKTQSRKPDLNEKIKKKKPILK